MPLLRDTTGNDGEPKEFNRMLQPVIEADRFSEQGMELTETSDRAPAALFQLRGRAEMLPFAEKMRAEEEQRLLCR